MRAISNFTWSNVTTSELVFEGGGRRRMLTVVRAPRARSARLTVDPRDANVRLAIPPRASLRQALGWAAEKRIWVESELGKLPPPVPITPGMNFMFCGAPVRLDWRADAPRRARLAEGVLALGGPRDTLAARLLRYLRREAGDLLEAETRELAVCHGITVGKVGVGDPKSRWGSCAATGDIRYSWRLILTPDFVRRATVAHEVAHRVHMNHSRAFHACAAELFGADPAPARHWLRANGAGLHWFGRDG